VVVPALIVEEEAAPVGRCVGNPDHPSQAAPAKEGEGAEEAAAAKGGDKAPAAKAAEKPAAADKGEKKEKK